MNYADIKKADLNNGDGIRISLWVTGCPIHCKSCHNKEIWNPETGKPFTKDTMEYLLNLYRHERIDKNLSILGGEPLARYNIEEVTNVCKEFKKEFPTKTIWLWTGFEYDEVKNFEVMKYLDKVITGRYIESLEKADWRGSSNQQIIDLNKQRKEELKMQSIVFATKKPPRGFEPVKQSMLKSHKRVEDVVLPIRKTKDSAGYDFVLPHDIVLEPQDQITIWTDVKAFMQGGEFLDLNVRSSSGIKLGLVLSNTRGIIDRDYYSNESNDGNIGICIKNTKPKFELIGYQRHDVITDVSVEKNSKTISTITVPVIKDLTEENTVTLTRGEAVAQGLFARVLPSFNCNTDNVRTGGIGSTGK